MAVKKRMYTGDLKPDYVVELSDLNADGVADPDFDLSLATEVRVVGKILLPNADSSVPLFNRAATGVNGATVTMFWEASDTSRVGLISTEVEVMWPGSKPQTFRPAELVQVLQDFGGTATSAP